MKAASLAGGGAIERRRLAFAALSATNEAILRSSNAGEMLQKVTEAAVDGGGFLGAAIFRKEDGSARLQMEAGAGEFVALIAKVQISTDLAVPHGQGLGGIAVSYTHLTLP